MPALVDLLVVLFILFGLSIIFSPVLVFMAGFLFGLKEKSLGKERIKKFIKTTLPLILVLSMCLIVVEFLPNFYFKQLESRLLFRYLLLFIPLWIICDVIGGCAGVLIRFLYLKFTQNRKSKSS